ncbi:MAG: MFS transporter, partial [Planctomycetota bacterium]|nr:MFS transporter [Planctomycetota bacterium]
MPDAPVPESAQPAAKEGAWVFSYGGFVRLFSGSLLATLGDRFYQMAAIAAVMLAFPDPSSAIAGITLAGVIPQFFFYPMIGSVVDSFDRRRLLWCTAFIKAPVVWLMMFLLLGDLKSEYFRGHWMVLLPVVFLLSLVTVPFGPARASAIPDVVPPKENGIAASLLAVTGLVSILFGTYIG